MGIEVNLMQNYPYSQRDISGRLESKTQHDKLIAMEFGQEFFDGSRNHGYGGFSYNSRFWKNVVPDFIQHWQLKNGDSLLDIGCAKGFMLYDLKEYLPNLKDSALMPSQSLIVNNWIKRNHFKYIYKLEDLLNYQLGQISLLPFRLYFYSPEIWSR